MVQHLEREEKGRGREERRERASERVSRGGTDLTLVMP